MARLILEHNSQVLKDHSCTKRNVTIGRHADNTIVLDDPLVSAYHARIDRKGVNYILTDLQSTNGTFVNNISIVSHILAHGDKIMIGGHAILFVGTELEKVYAEKEKLDLNKTVMRGIGKKGRIPSNSKTIPRTEITPTNVNSSRPHRRIALVALSIFVLSLGGWYLITHGPSLLKSVPLAAKETELNEGEKTLPGTRLSKNPLEKPESIPFTGELVQRSTSQPPKEVGEPLQSGEKSLTPNFVEDREVPLTQSSYKSEGMTKTVSDEIDQPEFVLEGIVVSSESNESFAVINGRMVRAGGRIEKGTLAEIGRNYVVIQYSKDNSKLKLALRR